MEYNLQYNIFNKLDTYIYNKDVYIVIHITIYFTIYTSLLYIYKYLTYSTIVE